MPNIPSFTAQNNELQDHELEDLAQAARDVVEGLNTLMAYFRANDERIIALQPTNGEVGLKHDTAQALGFADANDAINRVTQAMIGAIDLYNMTDDMDRIRALLGSDGQ